MTHKRVGLVGDFFPLAVQLRIWPATAVSSAAWWQGHSEMQDGHPVCVQTSLKPMTEWPPRLYLGTGHGLLCMRHNDTLPLASFGRTACCRCLLSWFSILPCTARLLLLPPGALYMRMFILALNYTCAGNNGTVEEQSQASGRAVLLSHWGGTTVD